MTVREPAFARDSATAAYYERRAREYDDWYEGVGRFAERHRPGWAEELAGVVELLKALPPARTLDLACGTGYLTRYLGGLVVAADRSPAMVDTTRARLRQAHSCVVVADALALPFAAGTFDRVLTGHFYGHLPPAERAVFLPEARRVGRELVVVDSARRAGVPAQEWQERVLDDGSRHQVFKRYLTADELAAEIAGEVLLSGRWFVAARAVIGG